MPVVWVLLTALHCSTTLPTTGPSSHRHVPTVVKPIARVEMVRPHTGWIITMMKDKKVWAQWVEECVAETMGEHLLASAIRHRSYAKSPVPSVIPLPYPHPAVTKRRVCRTFQIDFLPESLSCVSRLGAHSTPVPVPPLPRLRSVVWCIYASHICGLGDRHGRSSSPM